MLTRMSGRAFGAAILALLFIASAAAQAQNIVRVRGTIESAEGQTFTAKGRDGAPIKVKLADNTRILTLDRKSLADVKQGAFVGITAMPQPDGTQKAVEIHIFPEAMRGTGEGHRPWDLMPNSTMTNANIDSAVVVAGGRELVLKYKDGEKKFIVPADTEVVMFVPATAADLKPGERIVMSAKKLPDGTAEALFIIVGRNGVNPPM
jgi:hypothetical protein